MLNLFRKKSSRQTAKDRLKILLISDRVNCTAQTMELIKMDIAKVISKYMKIDTSNMEIVINSNNVKGKRMKRPTLYANIPILDIKNG